ncbi:hypothetical protein JCM9534A_06120 [Catenuloplanes indicus JCM 9534]
MRSSAGGLAVSSTIPDSALASALIVVVTVIGSSLEAGVLFQDAEVNLCVPPAKDLNRLWIRYDFRPIRTRKEPFGGTRSAYPRIGSNRSRRRSAAVARR